MFRLSSIRQATCILASVINLSLVTPQASAQALAADAALDARAGGLTSDEVARRATSTSPAAEQKRQEVEQARAQFDKTFTDFLPRFSLAASYTRLSKVDNAALGPVVIKSLQDQTVLSTSASLPLSDYVLRLVQARQASGAQLGAAEQSLQATLRKAKFDARALYYDWVQAELESAVAAQNLDLSRENLTRIRALAAADSASEADVARVEATAASSELLLEQAKNLARLQRERIRIAMHSSAPAEYAIGEDFQSAPPEAAGVDDLQSLTRRALLQRPELKALALQTRAYDKQVAVARSRAYPRLDASFQTQLANPNARYFPQEDEFHSTWQVGVQLSFSPTDAFNGSSDAAAARAKAAASEAQEKELLDAVRTEVTDAVLSQRNAVAALVSSAQRVKAAETSYRARHELFLVDKATTVELTEAQTELFHARLDDARAKVAIRLARVRLAYVTGEAS
jgi:outer membrane protein TolC